jgi:hypothetical protein
MLVLDAFKDHLAEKVKTHNTYVHRHSDHSRGMTFELQDLKVAVNRPFSDCHLCGERLLSASCPVAPTHSIRKPSETFLGMIYYQNLLPGVIKSAVCEVIQMEQRQMSCGSNIWNRGRCPVGARYGTEADALWEQDMEQRQMPCGSKIWNGGRCPVGARYGMETDVLWEQDMERRQMSYGSKIWNGGRCPMGARS